jgi:hypothetical protein
MSLPKASMHVSSPYNCYMPAHLILLDLVSQVISLKRTQHKASSYVVFSTPLLPRSS